MKKDEFIKTITSSEHTYAWRVRTAGTHYQFGPLDKSGSKIDSSAAVDLLYEDDAWSLYKGETHITTSYIEDAVVIAQSWAMRGEINLRNAEDLAESRHNAFLAHIGK